MQLGFRPFRLFSGDLPRIFDFAAEIGATAVQLDLPDPATAPAICAQMARTGVGVVSICAMSCAMLGPDMAQSAHEQGQVRTAIAVAAALGAPCVSQFAGHHYLVSLEENMARFAEVYGPLARYAEDRGVTLVFENCPMVGGLPRVARNLAYCPAHWRAMFAAVPSPALGLEMDFGHFPYTGVDALRAIRDFAPRIRHVHVKDAVIDGEAEYDNGLLGGRPHAFCQPGDGAQDFRAIVATLAQVGYTGHLTADLHTATEEDHRQMAGYLRGLMRDA